MYPAVGFHQPLAQIGWLTKLADEMLLYEVALKQECYSECKSGENTNRWGCWTKLEFAQRQATTHLGAHLDQPILIQLFIPIMTLLELKESRLFHCTFHQALCDSFRSWILSISSAFVMGRR